MKSFTIKEIKRTIDGKIVTWNDNRTVEYFVDQPEEPLANCLYFLFEGYDDENNLIKKLINSGAAGVVVREPHDLSVDKWIGAGIGIIEVKSITESYVALSSLYRSRFNIPFVEVIGSSGKTTTKEIIGAVLNAKIKTLVGHENFNAPSGVAYNIFSLRDEHKAAVLEVGMKGPGIMRLSSEIIKPYIGVLTSIQRAHFVSMGSIENIIEAKSEMLECLDENGLLIINGEDKNCGKFPTHRYKGKILKYGFSDKFDIWASNIEYKDFKTYFVAKGKDINMNCVINTVGKYNVSNALAAILVGFAMGLNKEEIINGLSNFQTLSGRLRIHKCIKDTILINDNFNANPDSTKSLLEEVPKFIGDRPLMLVMGDMERPDDEIKKYAKEVHFKIGEQIGNINFEYLIAIGRWAKEYINGAKSKGVPKSKMIYFETVEEAEEHFKASIIPGSVIVFKASLYVPVRYLIKSLGVDYH